MFHHTGSALALLIAGSLAASAPAELIQFSPNIDNWGWTDPDSSGSATPEVVWETTFPLPGVISVSTVMFELAHPVMSDVHLTLTAPNGDEFLLARGHDFFNTPPYTAPYDTGDLGSGNPGDGGDLPEVEPYWFSAAGAVWNDGDGLTSPIPGGTFQAESWPAGPWVAGDWTLRVVDAWDTIGAGALGDVLVRYVAVPEPCSLVLLGCGGLIVMRRRRRRR